MAGTVILSIFDKSKTEIFFAKNDILKILTLAKYFYESTFYRLPYLLISRIIRNVSSTVRKFNDQKNITLHLL